MSANFFNKITKRSLCFLLVFVMITGFIPVSASADAKYDDYLAELAEYNEKKAAYDTYLQNLDYYNAHNAEWEAYDEQLVKYNVYLTYLEELAAYNAAVENYQNDLDAYLAYTQYGEKVAQCEAKLVILDAIVYGTMHRVNMYETLMGETVESVLANEDLIAGYTTVSKQAVRDAGSATHALIDILIPYTELDAPKDRFNHYKSNYAALRDNFGQLYGNLYELYKDSAVKAKLKMEEKDHRYCEFLCQLYTIWLCLDDTTTIKKNWRISAAEGWLSLTQLGGYEGLEDTNSASPESLTFPNEAPPAEYPEIPEMPTQVPEVLEPIAPSGVRPVLPAPVEAPGTPPTLPTYTITWKNYDGTVLKTDTVAYGNTPNYNGAKPTKPGDAQNTYEFSGWSPAVSAVTGDATYLAQFSSQVKSYTVTWKNYDGTVLKTDTVAYGNTPNYNGTKPTKPGDAQNTYEFRAGLLPFPQ